MSLRFLPPRWRKAAALLLALGAALATWRAREHLALPSPSFSTALIPELSLRREAAGVFVSDVSVLARVPVLSVVDGDTLRVSWEGREERLRYVGVNTPERDAPCFEEASARNAALAGREVLLAFDERPRDKYGRLLAYVFTPEGRSIDAALVEEGLAKAWRRDGRWRDAFEALEKEAWEGRSGCLWDAEPPPRPKKKKSSPRRKRH